MPRRELLYELRSAAAVLLPSTVADARDECLGEQSLVRAFTRRKERAGCTDINAAYQLA